MTRFIWFSLPVIESATLGSAAQRHCILPAIIELLTRCIWFTLRVIVAQNIGMGPHIWIHWNFRTAKGVQGNNILGSPLPPEQQTYTPHQTGLKYNPRCFNPPHHCHTLQSYNCLQFWADSDLSQVIMCSLPLIVKMGASSSRDSLSQDDLEFLVLNTHYDNATICDSGGVTIFACHLRK